MLSASNFSVRGRQIVAGRDRLGVCDDQRYAAKIARRLASVTINAGTPIHAIQKACQHPMISPKTSVMARVGIKEKPKTVLA